MFPSGLRTLLTAAGVFIPLALSNAQACDNDRFPCPVVSEVAPQDTVDIVAEPPAIVQPRKKAQQASRQSEPQKPSATAPKSKHSAPSLAKDKAKVERAAPSNPKTNAAQEQLPTATGQETSILPSTAAIAPAVPPSPATEQTNRPQTAVVAAAGPDWPAVPNAEPGGAVDITVADATAVQVVDANEINELDQAAIANTTAMSPWIPYALLILGAAFAAGGTWFLARMMPKYARRPADT